MSENWPIVLIEGIIVFGGALAFAWWQLREIKRDQKIAAEKKRAAQEQAEQDRSAAEANQAEAARTPKTERE